MSCFQRKLQRGKVKLCITKGANMETVLVEEGLHGSKTDQLPCVSYPLCYCWCVLKTNQGDLCSCTDVLPGATGCTLGVCIVFWPMGLVDNLHLVAIECDGAEVSTGPWIRSVGCWFITWHANRARWCISKKFTKIIIEIHMRCRNSDSAQGCLALQPPAPSHLSSDLIDLYFDRY